MIVLSHAGECSTTRSRLWHNGVGGASQLESILYDAPQREPHEQQRSGEATASMVLGLFFFFPITALLAVIFGHMATASIKRSDGRLIGRGFATVGLVLGYIGLVLGLLGGMYFLAVHRVEMARERMKQNEKDTRSALLQINTATLLYRLAYPKVGFPPTLTVLGDPKNIPANATRKEREALATPDAAGLLFDTYASGVVNENYGSTPAYRLTYTPGKVVKGRISSYTVNADPVSQDVTGWFHFFTDDTGVIRSERFEKASADSPPVLHQ